MFKRKESKTFTYEACSRHGMFWNFLTCSPRNFRGNAKEGEYSCHIKFIAYYNFLLLRIRTDYWLPVFALMCFLWNTKEKPQNSNINFLFIFPQQSSPFHSKIVRCMYLLNICILFPFSLLRDWRNSNKLQIANLTMRMDFQWIWDSEMQSSFYFLNREKGLTKNLMKSKVKQIYDSL